MIEYLPIPRVPDHLVIQSFEEYNDLELASPKEVEELNIYSLRKANNIDLEKFLQPHFDFDLTDRVYYQYIGANVPIHIDIGRTFSFNYIINTGGESVSTIWYETDEKTILRSEIIPKFVWHKFISDIPHNVVGMVDKRFGLTVF